MIFGRYRDPAGRACPIYRPDTLRQVELNLEEYCQDHECPDGPPGGAMETIRRDERVYVQEAGVVRELTGSERDLAIRKENGDRLTRFALEHRERTGCSLEQAFAVARRLNPEWVEGYTGAPRPVLDYLRRQDPAQGYVVETEGGIRFHVSGAAPKAEDQPDPDEDDVVTIVERGVGRYIVHGAIATHAAPDTKKAKAVEARKALWRRAWELSKLSPADAMLQAVLEHPELLEVILQGKE